MAEEKIIKHAGEAARALLKKDVGWKKKIREFFFEILIIVIAVSITLWFHNWNDHLHEKQLASDFLTGVREDLKITADKLEIDIKAFQHTLDYYDTIWKQIREKRVDKRYMDSASGNLTNMVGFAFDNSRFESFKSSGNLRLIENRSLMQDLTRMYTVTLPDRQESDRMIFQERRNQYITYIGTKTPIGPDGSSQISEFISDPAIQFQIMWQGALLNEIKAQKTQLIKEIRTLIGEIDRELQK
jgi:hypothetical protein